MLIAGNVECMFRLLVVGHVMSDVVIYLHNKDKQDALFFLIYFSNHPLHVSNRLTIHHQEVLVSLKRFVTFHTIGL